ncbi:hypothetical protein [Vibrio sp. 16]|uniref:hypothetical protein n=1 Tax=Vibrio sp. 16 TaxID=391586 RepID=UPI00018F1D6B|nr:hypothetical protein [Vibrio sp. 16]EED27318.1 hypothetical protein VPMS16_2875 [Vibrio sp. 16]CAK4066790.1 hypothetical protein VDT1_0154 [Vibrio sp. 16]
MKVKISLLTIVVASVVGCANADTAEPVETPSWLTVNNEGSNPHSWNSFGSLSFEASTSGVATQKYQIHKAPVGQVMSITGPDGQFHMIGTQQNELLKGVGLSGVLSHEECMEQIGEIGIAVQAQPSVVRFFLEQGRPQGPRTMTSAQDFSVNESANNAEIAIGEATTVEIEGQSYPIGPMLELSAPWGASGTITPTKSIEFAFQYYSTTDGQKETVNISGKWSPEMGPMDKFNHEPMTEWLACVTPEVKATLVEQKAKLVGETLEIMTQAELANGAI